MSFCQNKRKKKQVKLENILLIFHPVLNQINQIETQIENILEALLYFKVPINIIYPNNDFGFLKILKFINKNKKSKKVKVLKNLDRNKFLRLLYNSSIIVGNSSCGIIEAPSFKIPTINIGNRQNERPRAKSIIDTDFNKKNIIKSINYVFYNKKFKKKLLHTKNIFYKKNSGYLICKILDKILSNKINFKMEKY